MATPAAGDLRTIRFCGQPVSAAQWALLREVVETCSGLSRTELARTVCDLLEWRRPNGGLKAHECRMFLEDLGTRGLLVLPASQATRPLGRRTTVPSTAQGDEQPELVGTVRDVAPVTIALVQDEGERRLWRELVGRHHYLGHKVAFGASLRYLVRVERPQPTVVGCLQFSSPAWRMEARDRWIGWDDDARRRNLQRVVQNSRFLLLPWVRVRNLATTVLSLAARRLPQDWWEHYRVQPVLLETLVDPSRFTGTCYQAANWLELGVTTGRGRMDRLHQRGGAAPKTVWVYPLGAGATDELRTVAPESTAPRAEPRDEEWDDPVEEGAPAVLPRRKARCG